MQLSKTLHEQEVVMQFHEKLHFLMEVTQTSNSALARYVVLDASYISRLRSGKRLPPKNEDLIGQMAAYFSRNCREPHRHRAITDALNAKISPSDQAMMAEAIAA